MVGARIRMFRVDRGISQTMLAERIGVTFQQVQKYERGADRVGASLLAQIASVLGVSVGELFFPARIFRLEFTGSFARRAGRLARSQGLARMISPRVRRCVAKLVESIGDRTAGAKATVARLNTVDRGDRRRFPSWG
ncbi:helix-turn-helix domain-containing protein [Bradyrhizobium sp. RDI18]|uniref:helix-turn-helix domain-containing protein n=1 Tax=Bradyrhizobium sp. RDI18 TaxID=3367400 RepID=UPI003716DBDD